MREELINLINGCDVVSFDIFDTLLFRNLYIPTDLFKILEKIALEKYNISDFYDLRICCEKNSRTSLNNYECTLSEIYNEVAKQISNKRIANELKKCEIELEKEFCVVNPFMKKIYDYCIKNKKKVILISDMYLEKKVILDILSHIGYDSPKLYLSNEFHATKGSSELFKIVYDENQFDKSKWLHIGDNIISDYEVPISFGINAYNYKNVSTYFDSEPNSIFESIVLGIQNNFLYNGLPLNYWEKFGVRYASLIYFGFTKWLYDLTKNENNLFFLARDGYIIKKIYDLLNDNSKIFTNYIYCSRKSIQIPSLIYQDKNKLVDAFSKGYSPNFKISLKKFLENASVNLDNINDYSSFHAFGFYHLDDVVCMKNYDQARKLLAKLIGNIEENLSDSRNLVISYLKQEKLNDFEKINIMDIGWSGSIQEAIGKLLGKEVIGYYFGTIDSGKKDAFCNMFGYYFDLDKEEKDKESVFSNVMMYELLFSAPHGSTIGYQYKNDKIFPVLDEDLSYNKVIEKIQDSALNIIKKYIKYIKYFDRLDKHFCVSPYEQFLNNYCLDDVKMFKDLSNDYLLGSSKKIKYVSEITIDEIENSSEDLLSKLEGSLWKNAFYISDIDGEDIELWYEKCKYKINNLKYKDLSSVPLNCAKLYLDYGEGFSEDNVIFIPYQKIGLKYSFEFKIPSFVKSVRIDPVEGFFVKITELMIFTDNGNVQCKIPHKSAILGKLKKCIYIYSRDPKIVVYHLENDKFLKFFANIEIVR